MVSVIYIFTCYYNTQYLTTNYYRSCIFIYSLLLFLEINIIRAIAFRAPTTFHLLWSVWYLLIINNLLIYILIFASEHHLIDNQFYSIAVSVFLTSYIYVFHWPYRFIQIFKFVIRSFQPLLLPWHPSAPVTSLIVCVVFFLFGTGK